MRPPSSHTTVRTVPYTAVPDKPWLFQPQCPLSCMRPTLPRGFRPLLPVLGPLTRHLQRTVGNQYNSTCQVRPFTKRSTQLIWLRLTSDGHLRRLSTTLVPKPRQTDRPPRVMRVTFTLMPAAFTSAPSVQVQGFEGRRLLTQCDRLLCDFCSSGQRFACGFLQIPPRDGHPCRPANRSPCRAGRGLAPPSRPINHHS